MKIFHLLITLLFFSNGFGQNSYYFSDPVPTAGRKTTTTDQKYFGEYTSTSSLLKYHIDEKGIRITSTQISSISKEFIRENSSYQVKNGFIHGVIENDSLPCALENGRYYFGLHNTEILSGEGSQNQLIRISATKYVLNYFENGSYIPMIIEFTGKTMQIKELDYDPAEDEFAFIAKKTKIPAKGQSIIVLSPTTEESQQVMQESFVNGAQFSR